jgi:hypothetical protein
MAPVIRISDDTYAHMQRHARPFEDSPDSVIAKALAALDMMTGEPPPAPRTQSTKKADGPKLPQKDFRVPLLLTLLKVGGSAAAKDVRSMMEPMMAAYLNDGDYESVSTGDPRWWNAVCWERNDLVKEGLMRDDSTRGVWEISENGKNLAASLHTKAGKEDRMSFEGSLSEVASRFWRRPIGPRPFVMMGDLVFKEVKQLNPILLTRLNDVQLSIRTSNGLRNDNIIYLGELVQKTEEELLRTPNFGRKSLNEIKEELSSKGLQLGTRLENWPPRDLEAKAERYAAEQAAANNPDA